MDDEVNLSSEEEDFDNQLNVLPPIDSQGQSESPEAYFTTPLSRPVVPEVAQRKSVIWGTTIEISTTTASFGKFVKSFKKDSGDTIPHYMQLLDELIETEQSTLNLNCQHLWDFDPVLYSQLVQFPAEVIPVFESCLQEIAIVTLNAPEESYFEVRPFGLRKVVPMRDLNPSDIDKLITVQGMIIRSGTIIPDLRVAFFRCLCCKNEVTKPMDRNVIEEPVSCEKCRTRNSFELIHNRCTFSNKQCIKLQETVESIPEGETPQTVNLVTFDSLVDTTHPGDKVLATGIYRAQPIRQSSTRRTMQQIFRTYIDVVHFKTTQTGRIGSGSDAEPEDTTNESTAEREQRDRELRELGKTPKILDLLVKSFAPSIWELDDIKKGVLAQLFGGTNKRFSNKGTHKFRPEINVLLCGDPGTSKSQMLQYVHKIAPRGLYTSGKGSSAVGLTAYVTKDPDTGETVLESGALVLSDNGVCCIDEFDKMSDQTRSILHEAMEQQTVSVAKAGIVCSLPSRTSILASANPTESKYNPTLSVVDNIQLPPTLLSRFDLIYLVLDKPQAETDRKLARHLVSLYFERPEQRETGLLSKETLKDYIAYARKHCNPVISDQACDKLVEGYVQMRHVRPNQRTVSATARQLESLIRLAEAFAKMELSDIVTEAHVAEAIRLVKVAIQEAATDPKTGQIDMDLITTGRSAATRQILSTMKKAVMDLLSAGPPSVKTSDLFVLLQEQSSVPVQREQLESVLDLLAEEGVVSLQGLRNRTVTRLEAV